MGELVQLDPGKKVQRWTIDKKLGEGAFGAVYKVSDKTGTYALKVEGANEQIQLLKMEVFVLNELSKAGGRHFCKIEDKGRFDNFNYVVMTFVGKSLQDLRLGAPGKKFSIGTAISIGIQCLEALEDLHGIGYLHRDVKPANYTVGRAELKELRKVYVLDFGMARKFVHEDGTIRKPRAVAGFRGTVKYAPVACHAQRELCRLDDVESWLYQQVEFTKGSLPWQDLKDMDEIGRFKRSCRTDTLKQLFGGCPREYVDIMKTIDSGRFFDEPNYSRIYNLLRAALRSLNVQEFPYDWEDKKWDEYQKVREEEEKKKAKAAAAAEAAKPKKEKEEKTKEEKSGFLENENKKDEKGKENDDKKEEKKDEGLVQLDPGKKVERWTIDKKLGEGAFGAVYKVSDKTGTYALKVEGANEQIQLLKMEVFVLNELSKAGGRHFCKIEDRGRVDNFIYVVMTFVGKSLQDLRLAAPGKKFSIGTALSIGIQCLEALEDLHGIGYLHRDVKPANYTIGRAELKELRKVYVLDFGMARKFVHEDGTIRKPRAVAGFRGTVKYAPVACHAQRELCRLDDVESWLYQQVEFTRGSLPWQDLKDMDEIGRFKKACRAESLKQFFAGCPREYVDILKTIDGGRFFDEPNYSRIYNLLRTAMKTLNAQEFPYDWEEKKWDDFQKAREEEEKKKAKAAEAAKPKKDEKSGFENDNNNNKKDEKDKEKDKENDKEKEDDKKE